MDLEEQLDWKRDHDARTSGITVRIPLWKLLEYGGDYWKHETERAAREFGFHQIKLDALRYDQPVAELTISYSQTYLLGAS
jgi:hypothetical protein